MEFNTLLLIGLGLLLIWGAIGWLLAKLGIYRREPSKPNPPMPQEIKEKMAKELRTDRQVGVRYTSESYYYKKWLKGEWPK